MQVTRDHTQVRNILFPTDFSETSRNALAYAVDLAAHVGAKIMMFHAYHEIPVAQGVAPDDFLDRMRAEKEALARERFEEYEAEAIARAGSDVELIPMLESGRAYEKILEVAQNEQIDMIVMGTRGIASQSQHIFGSLTTRIIEAADCPVFAVPEGVTFQPIQHILYASNFEEADFAILDRLLDIADLFKAQVSCAHVYAGDEDWAQLDRTFFERLYHLEREYDQLKFFTFNHRNVINGLHRFVAANKVDLLTMLTHRRDAMHHALEESLTRKMTLHTEVPLLAFHD